MNKVKTYENFPVWIPVLSNTFALLIYVVGAYILSGFGMLFTLLYLLYCLWVEITILKGSCVNCYYYGKICGLGKGKLCSLILKKGDPQKFAEKELSWYKLLPDFIVFIFPIVGGIILLVRDFTWFLAAILTVFVILYFGGNAVIRGSFVCKHCMQRKIGCPAEQMFRKEKEQKLKN